MPQSKRLRVVLQARTSSSVRRNDLTLTNTHLRITQPENLILNTLRRKVIKIRKHVQCKTDNRFSVHP